MRRPDGFAAPTDWVRFGFTLLFAGEKLCGKRISRYGALAYLWAKRRDDQKEAESLDRYFEISTLQNTAPIETCHFISGPLPCMEVLGGGCLQVASSTCYRDPARLR